MSRFLNGLKYYHYVMKPIQNLDDYRYFYCGAQKIWYRNKKSVKFRTLWISLKTYFLQNVKMVFFPPSCTSKLQLLDLGIIKILKVHNRKRLIDYAFQNISTGHGKINVLQAINIIFLAWN